MPAKRRSSSHGPQGQTPRERGLQAYQHGRFDEAIRLWQPLADDPAVAHALAEAHFRRALSATAMAPADDLRRAAVLAPDDVRFPFHLGRVLHRAGDLAGADAQYRAVLARNPAHTAAARLLALLALEQHLFADLDRLPGAGPAVQQWAAPALALLRSQPPPPDGSPVGTFWHGLGLLTTGSPEALAALRDERPLPPTLAAQRTFYRGAALALAGDGDGALTQWRKIYQAGHRHPALLNNLAALVAERLGALLEAGEIAAAGALAQEWEELPGNQAFDELRVLALDRAAQAAAAADDWEAAAEHWEAAREILAGAQGLGSPRPLLHNLALAYERLELWEEAADSWRALLRTRPRKRAATDADAQDEERWGWVRKRVIECYRRAGRPDEAVTVFRQMIKADPDDLDMRIELADALYANEQERAALNEIKRVLEIDPSHPDALARYADALTGQLQFAEAEQVARKLAAAHPGRADMQRHASEIFLHHGRQYAGYGNFQTAYAAFVEGERYDPSNPRFAINQARMLSNLGRPEETPALLDRALAVAGDQNDTWVLVVETWVMEGKLDEARALIARFERERSPGPDDYVELGRQLLATALPPPQPTFMLHLAPPPPPADTPATRLGVELLDKAVALRPDDQALLLRITGALMLPRPDLACRYAERAVQLAPDDPDAVITLGVALGLADKVPDARKTLQRGAQLARRAGRPDLVEYAQSLRDLVGTPVLRMMLTAGMSGELPDLDELEDLFG